MASNRTVYTYICFRSLCIVLNQYGKLSKNISHGCMVLKLSCTFREALGKLKGHYLDQIKSSREKKGGR